MRIALVLLAAMPLIAQPQVTVAETAMRDARGIRVGGRFTIAAAAAFTAPDGSRIDTSAATVPVVNGMFSVALWPGTYTVNWQLSNSAPRRETWLVVAGTSPVGVNSVVTTVVLPNVLVQPAQINAAGLTTGSYCFDVVTGAVAGLGACGGGGGGISGTNTWSQIEAGNVGSGNVTGTSTWAQIEAGI